MVPTIAQTVPYSMPDHKPRIGIIGAGLVTPFHALGVRAVGAELAFVASRSTANAGRWADLLQTQACRFDELDTVLRHPPDLVIIASPDHLHAAHARLALQAGAGVLVEKPLTQTMDEATALLNTVQPVFYAENHVHAPVLQRLKQRVHQPRQIKACFSHAGPMQGSQSVTDSGIPAPGAWFDLGSHLVTTVAWLVSSDMNRGLQQLQWHSVEPHVRHGVIQRMVATGQIGQTTVTLEASWQADHSGACHYWVEDAGLAVVVDPLLPSGLWSADLVDKAATPGSLTAYCSVNNADQLWLPETTNDVARLGGYVQQIQQVLQQAPVSAGLPNGLTGLLTVQQLQAAMR